MTAIVATHRRNSTTCARLEKAARRNLVDREQCASPPYDPFGENFSGLTSRFVATLAAPASAALTCEEAPNVTDSRLTGPPARPA
jgi:hypothetical protein